MRLFLTTISLLLLATKSFAVQRTLSICAIFQNEAPYLKEWIEYHKLVGVEHFYLYNDRSQDNYLAILAPYINSGEVELFDCALKGELHFFNQRRAYVRGLNAAKGVSQWVAFIDLDEFIVPKKDDSIPDLLLRYEDHLGIMIQWQKFGTSGYWEIPQGSLMIELLTKASPIDDEDNFVTKSIVQLDLLPASFFDEEYVVANAIDLVHFCQYAPYDGVKARRIGPISHQGRGQLTVDREEAQINHYWCRSEKYYLEEKVGRKARLQNEDFGKPYPWPEEKVMKYLHLYNFRTDEAILRFVPLLKNQLMEIVR